MKKILLFISLVILFSCMEKKVNEMSQINDTDTEDIHNINLYKDITINSMPVFGVHKNNILKDFGNPLKISKSDYECGSFSNEVQNQKFELLHYNGFQFIGNEESNYFLDEINFKIITGNIKFNVGDKNLNKETTPEELIKELGTKIKFQKEDHALIFPTNSDFQIVLEFENDKLSRCYLSESC